MKHSNKVCAHDKVIVALNADKDKYLNYEKSTSGDNILKRICAFHDDQRFNFFRIQKNFNINDSGYARVTFPEMIALKQNANIKLIVYYERKLLAHGSGKTLPVDKCYHHLSGISMQQKVKKKTGVLLHQYHKPYIVSMSKLLPMYK